MPESDPLDTWPIGTRVIVRSPDSLYDGASGIVKGRYKHGLVLVRLDDSGLKCVLAAEELRTTTPLVMFGMGLT